MVEGLFLLVTPTGGKLWRLKYRFGGTEKLLAIGTYPQISLAEARQKRDQASASMPVALTPATPRKHKRRQAPKRPRPSRSSPGSGTPSFRRPGPTATANKIIRRLELYVFPWLGGRPIKSITAPDLLTVLRRIEAKGALDTAHRTQQNCGQVFRYAVATGRADRDPSGDLRGAIPPAAGKHMATITDPKEIAGLLRSIDRLPRQHRYPLRPAVGAIGLCPPGGTATCRVVGVRPGCGGMADSRRKDEGGRPCISCPCQGRRWMSFGRFSP